MKAQINKAIKTTVKYTFFAYVLFFAYAEYFARVSGYSDPLSFKIVEAGAYVLVYLFWFGIVPKLLFLAFKMALGAVRGSISAVIK